MHVVLAVEQYHDSLRALLYVHADQCMHACMHAVHSVRISPTADKYMHTMICL
jgi:hypothetical protein